MGRLVKHMVTQIYRKQLDVEKKLDLLQNKVAGVMTTSGSRLGDSANSDELTFQQKFVEQENGLEKTIGFAMERVSNIALEAAYEAASLTAQRVITQPCKLLIDLADKMGDNQLPIPKTPTHELQEQESKVERHKNNSDFQSENF